MCMQEALDPVSDAVRELIELRKRDADEGEINEKLVVLESLSKDAMVDKVIPNQWQGAFKVLLLTGRTKQALTSSSLTLGAVSFGLWQPKDLLISLSEGDASRIFIQEEEGLAQAYTISTAFQATNEPSVQGFSDAIAEYTFSEENPRRVAVQFKMLRLRPQDGSSLGRWKEVLLANEGLDDRGYVKKSLPGPGAVGWVEVIVELPKLRVTKGNMGSVSLWERV
jgi:hypothetical protein